MFGGGGVLSQHALQVVSQHALQQVSKGGGGGIPAGLSGFQAHTQGGSLGGSGGGYSGPHPRGKLRGIWSRPTPKGEVEGDLAKGGVPAPGGGWKPPP